MPFAPDLPRYFDRIDYRGPTQPSLAHLNAIILAHVSTIPFENLDVLLGKPIDLAPQAVERKLIAERRGGYCFEQNTLLMHVLVALGYAVTPVSARVRIGRGPSDVPPRTHVFLRVTLPSEPPDELGGHDWLVDVGVGGLSPTSALRLAADVTQPTPHEPRRILRRGQWQGFTTRAPDATLLHQAYVDETWFDVCEFTLEPMPAIDRLLGNWYTSAHPESHFKNRLMVARATPSGRKSLLNRRYTEREPGTEKSRELANPAELRELLASEFGIELAEGAVPQCAGLDWPTPKS